METLWKLLVPGNGLLVQIKMRDYMDGGVIPSKRVTLPTEVLHLPLNRPYYCQHFGIRCINLVIKKFRLPVTYFTRIICKG